MSPIDLIILGFLYKREMSPYDLVSYIADMQINKFLKISAPAVYKRCKGLFAEGYFDGKTVKDGMQPEKTIYSINEKGKDHFHALMEHFSSNMTPFFLDCNAFIWNIDNLDKKEGLKMLNSLRKELNGLKAWIAGHEKEASHLPFSGRVIVKQYRMMIFTLNDWIDEVITEFHQIK